MRISYVLVFAAIACGTQTNSSSSDAEGVPASDRTESSQVNTVPSRTDSVLAVQGNDTVRITSDGGRHLIWTSLVAGSSITRFRSGDLFSGIPKVNLADMTADGTLDLFVTFDYEEMRSGLLLRGTPDGSSLAFSTAQENTCRVPELLDANGDGRLDVIAYIQGPFTAEMCRGEERYDVCSTTYPLYWAEVHVQDRAGAFDPTTTGLTAFYRQLRDEYQAALERLRDEPADGPCAGSELRMLLNRAVQRATELSN